MHFRCAIRSRLISALVVGSTFLVQGCAGGVSTKDAAGYDGRLAQGDYPGAAAFAVEAGKISKDGKSTNLLWSLDAGAAMVYSGDAARTIPVLDSAEEMMKLRDLGTTSEKGQYHAKTYDGVMTNAYKAVSAMQTGRSDIARTELLRAEDRQARAETEFQAEAAMAQAGESAPGNVNLASVLGAAQSNPDYANAAREMGNYGKYKPFINPFPTYLAGLYFLNTKDGDHDKARAAFERVRFLQGSNLLIDGDIALAKAQGSSAPKTWVIFENGQSSTIDEYSITFPVPVIGKIKGVSVATVALPRLHENLSATNGVLVGDKATRTVVVSNFDYVMRSEFQRRYPSIMRAAVLEAVLKIGLMNVAAQDKSGIALLAATVASNVSYTDVRSWSAMPKDFQAARIETPKDGQVRLRTDAGADLGSVTVPTNASSIVYVKMSRAGSPPSIQVLRF